VTDLPARSGRPQPVRDKIASWPVRARVNKLESGDVAILKARLGGRMIATVRVVTTYVKE